MFEGLSDGQIWESPQYVFKIESWGQGYRAIIFKKKEDELEFVTIDIGEERNIIKLIRETRLTLTNKTIKLEDKDGQGQNLGKL